jgi:hypothetical protein
VLTLNPPTPGDQGNRPEAPGPRLDAKGPGLHVTGMRKRHTVLRCRERVPTRSANEEAMYVHP